MLKNRVIPVLLMKDGGLVKGKKFKNHKYVGDPINAVKIFNEKEVDELVILDIAATEKRTGPDFELLEVIAGECFMPVCYGGGVKNLEEAQRIFNLGFEKISFQTTLFENPSLVKELVHKYGSQSIVASIDVKKNFFGKKKAYISSRKSIYGKNLLETVNYALSLGVGEIMLTSVDREGSFEGVDQELINEVSSAINVPLIVSGGVGSLQHIKEAINTGADAVGIGSFFVFHGPYKAVLITYPSYKDLEKFLYES